jgi:hypothetical protein
MRSAPTSVQASIKTHCVAKSVINQEIINTNENAAIKGDQRFTLALLLVNAKYMLEKRFRKIMRLTAVSVYRFIFFP